VTQEAMDTWEGKFTVTSAQRARPGDEDVIETWGKQQQTRRNDRNDFPF